MIEVEVTTKTKVALDLELVAAWFCELNDEQQADFFIKVSSKADEWSHHQNSQWYLVGRHLRDCSCSNRIAREMVQSISEGTK
jgi:hypothetical protein